jgi:hypothetical protein
VLVDADSLDTIRKTHAHYFDGNDTADTFRSLIVPAQPGQSTVRVLPPERWGG